MRPLQQGNITDDLVKESQLLKGQKGCGNEHQPVGTGMQGLETASLFCLLFCWRRVKPCCVIPAPLSHVFSVGLNFV